MIRTHIVSVVTIGSLFLAACGDDESKATTAVSDDAGADAAVATTSTPNSTSADDIDGTADASVGPDAAVDSRGDTDPADSGIPTGATGVDPGADSAVAPTFYEHVLPLFEQNCLGCHVDDGIGPMRLDDYASAKTYATAIQAATDSREMPPYLVTNDGSCGDFANSPHLSETELQTIRDWVAAGSPEGTPRDVEVPPSSALPDTYEISSPNFSPVAGGGALDAHDDYRCFVIDPPVVGKFITGYQVLPGNAKIVHHVVVNLVDMEGPSEYPATDGGVVTNADVIAALDAQDPDVEGYRCYGLAGDGVRVDSVPAVWAPGQATVHYPNEAGIPMLSNHKLVVQIHYNLVDHENVGSSDQTKIRFDIEEPEDVPNIGVYLPTDPLLNTLLSGGDPDVLPPGEASTKYIWEQSFEELGIGIPEFQLWGLFPHMHETGNKYTVELLRAGQQDDGGASAPQCEAQVNQWDFHWQHLYFYREGQVVTPQDKIRVTCDYDTSKRTEPTLPGWGTENEMCFLGLFVTVPNAQ
jgi:hypothetical protein